MNKASSNALEAPSVTPEDLNAAELLDSLHCQNTGRVSLHDSDSHEDFVAPDAAGEVMGAPAEKVPDCRIEKAKSKCAQKNPKHKHVLIKTSRWEQFEQGNG